MPINQFRAAPGEQVFNRATQTTQAAQDYDPKDDAQGFYSSDQYSRVGAGGDQPGAGVSVAGATPAAGGAGGYSSQLQSAIEQRYADRAAPENREDIRSRLMQEQQAQIDAINKRYQGQFARAEQQGIERLGEQRAMSVMGGTRFSPRGAAQKERVVDYNAEVRAAIDAKMATEMAAIFGKVDADTQAEVTRQAEAAQQAYSDYMGNLTKVYQLSQSEDSAMREEAYRRAVLTGYSGGDATLAMKQYLSEVENQKTDDDRQNKYIDAQIAEMQQKDYQIVQGADGTIMAINPNNPEDRQVIGNYARPIASSGGGGAGAGVAGLSQEDLSAYTYVDPDTDEIMVNQQAIADFGGSTADQAAIFRSVSNAVYQANASNTPEDTVPAEMATVEPAPTSGDKYGRFGLLAQGADALKSTLGGASKSYWRSVR